MVNLCYRDRFSFALAVSRDRLEVQTSRLPKFFRGASKSFTVPMSHVVDCSLCTASTQTGELPKELLSKVKFIISYLVSFALCVTRFPRAELIWCLINSRC